MSSYSMQVETRIESSLGTRYIVETKVYKNVFATEQVLTFEVPSSCMELPFWARNNNPCLAV